MPRAGNPSQPHTGGGGGLFLKRAGGEMETKKKPTLESVGLVLGCFAFGLAGFHFVNCLRENLIN